MSQCDAHIEPDPTSASRDDIENDESTTTKMALPKSGTIPGIATVWSDGSVSLHVITADVTPSVGSDGHFTKRTKQQKNSKNPKLELRQLWRNYPFQPNSEGENSTGEGSIVDFLELDIAFELGAIYGGTASSYDSINEEGKKRFGDNGAILLGGRFTLLIPKLIYIHYVCHFMPWMP